MAVAGVGGCGLVCVVGNLVLESEGGFRGPRPKDLGSKPQTLNRKAVLELHERCVCPTACAKGCRCLCMRVVRVGSHVYGFMGCITCVCGYHMCVLGCGTFVRQGKKIPSYINRPANVGRYGEKKMCVGGGGYSFEAIQSGWQCACVCMCVRACMCARGGDTLRGWVAVGLGGDVSVCVCV